MGNLVFPVQKSQSATPSPTDTGEGWGSRQAHPRGQGSASRTLWPRLEAPAPQHPQEASEARFANSLGSSWRPAGQALVSGKKNASAAYKKAQQTPAARARLFKRKKDAF